MPTINCTDCYRPLVEFQPFALLSQSIHVVVGLLLSQGCMSELLTLMEFHWQQKLCSLRGFALVWIAVNWQLVILVMIGVEWWGVASVVGTILIATQCGYEGSTSDVLIRIWLVIIYLWACSPCDLVRTNELTVGAFFCCWVFLPDNPLVKFEFVFFFRKSAIAIPNDFACSWSRFCTKVNTCLQSTWIIAQNSKDFERVITFCDRTWVECDLFKLSQMTLQIVWMKCISPHLCLNKRLYLAEIGGWSIPAFIGVKIQVCELAVHNKHSQKLVLWLTCV